MANMKQMEQQIQQLTKQLQMQNEFMNSPSGRKFKQMAELELNNQKQKMVAKYNRLQELQSKPTYMSHNVHEDGQMRFVKLDGVVTAYTTKNGRMSDLQPVTVDTFKAMTEAQQEAFASQFKSEALAIKYNSFNPTMSQEYFDKLVIADGTDWKLTEMDLNKPMLKDGLDWHKPEFANVREAYNNDYQQYLSGETNEMKAYVQETSIEGRMAIKNEIDTLKAEISNLEKEVGQGASYLASSGQFNGEGSQE